MTKQLQSVLLIAILTGCRSGPNPIQPTTAPAPGPLTVKDLNSKDIIGELGVPLGELIEGEANVFRGSDLGNKGDDGRYLLRVTRVNHIPLKSPVLMHFTVPAFVVSKLAVSEYQLIKDSYGNEPSSWSSDDIARLEKAYVGQVVRFKAYEVGSFSGLPTGGLPLPQIWQDHGFGFETVLVILDDHEQGNCLSDKSK